MRQGARAIGCAAPERSPRTRKPADGTVDPGNVYHSAFEGVGRLLAAPLRLAALRQTPGIIHPESNRRMTRTATMNTLNPLGTAHRLRRWGRMVRRTVVAPVVTWYQRQRMYEELNGLSDRVLADIGLSREQIPAVVKRAYRLETAAPPAADALVLDADPRPVASNDAVKQPLAA